MMAERKVLTALQGDFTVETVTGHVEAAGLVTAPPTRPAPVPEEHFIDAMRRLASGVVLVTTRVDGRPWGLTISSFCSLTLEPPQVLVSLQAETVSCRQILHDQHFGVSVLGADQAGLARVGAASGVAKFVDDYCSDSHTCHSPGAIDALCHLDCALTRAVGVGSHTILVGLVTGVAFGDPARARMPLVYVDRQFATPRALGDGES